MNTLRRALGAAIAALFVVVVTAAGAPAASTTTGDLYIATDTTLTEDHHGQVLIIA